MNPASLSAGVLVGVIFGFTVGYFLGRRITIDPSATSAVSGINAATPVVAEAPSTSAALPSMGDATSDSATVSKSLVERLREIAAIKSDVDAAYEAQDLIGTLELSDLPAALAQFAKLPPNPRRSQLVAMLLQHWGKLDGPAALAAAGQFRAHERLNAEGKALEGWATVDPAAAWSAARDRIAAHPLWTYQFAAGPLRELYRVNPAQAMAEALEPSTENIRRSLRLAIVAAAAQGGTYANLTQLAQQTDSAATREAWIKDIFESWGSADPDSSMNALKNLSDPALARSAMTGALTGWGNQDPVGALEYIMDRYGDPLVADALGPIAMRAVQFSSESELRTMMTAIAEKGAYATIGPQVSFHLAQSHPDLAMELAKSVRDERQRTSLTMMTLSAWAHNDFPAASSAYESLPDASTKAKYFGPIVNSALRQDGGPETVARWIEEFSGADRTRAASSLVSTLSNQPVTLSPEARAAFARVTSATPDLPPELQEKARTLFGSGAP